MKNKQKSNDTNTKNILLLTSFFRPNKGGIQTYTYEIAKNLQKMGNDVTTFAIVSNGITNIKTSKWLKVYKNGSKSSLRNVFIKHDFILATSWLPSAILGVLLSRLQKSKLFISAHGNEMMYPDRIPFLKKLMLFSFKNADKIFAVSNYTKNLLIKKGVEGEKVSVIPNGTNPKFFTPTVSTDKIVGKNGFDKKKIIFSVSRLVERKNFGIVIESMIEVLKEIPNAIYVIGGEGPMKEKWIELAIKNHVEDKVVFIGYVPDEDLPKYYTISDVFVLPSKEIKDHGEVEGFGIAFLEANACETPVVGGRSGGIEDAIVDGKTGYLVNPEDKIEIRKTIIKLLKNPILSKKLGKNGRKRVEEELSWEKVTKKLFKNMCG